jgi:hypothetical protein
MGPVRLDEIIILLEGGEIDAGTETTFIVTYPPINQYSLSH